MVDDSRQAQPSASEGGGLVEQTGRVQWHNRSLDLAEIENALLEWEGVRGVHVAALVCPRSREVARIVAHVAPANGDTALPFRALRGHLSARLPEHLQPTHLVICDRLPPSLCPHSVAPATEFEEVMADLFADLLHLPRVPMGGHFFELGGHSLLAVQLVARLRRALGVDIALSRVWETPTVAGLAEVVEMVYLATGAIDPSRRDLPRGALPDLLTRHAPPGEKPEAGGAEKPEVGVAEPRGGRQCFASLSQSSLYFLWCWDKDSPALNVSLPVRLLSRPIDQSALRSAIQSLLDRHPPLRTTYLLSDGALHAWVQGPGMCPVDLQVGSHVSLHLHFKPPQQRQSATPSTRRIFAILRHDCLTSRTQKTSLTLSPSLFCR
jgi:acyl carrier protein